MSEQGVTSSERAQSIEFESEIHRELVQTEEDVKKYAPSSVGSDKDSWTNARELVHRLNLIPWFIWRISNFALGKPGEIHQIPEGMIFGLRKLLVACATDPVIGRMKDVTSDRAALAQLSGDVFAASAVIHAVCRKLSKSPLERIWRPIIDDALIRCQIGYFVGKQDPRFGAGRGMLAGFAGRAGLAILIASGEREKAQKALEQLATGENTAKVGMEIYGADPLQVSAMVLAAAGCGRDAAFGTVSYSLNHPECMLGNEEQAEWLAAFSITENARMGTLQKIGEDTWEILSFDTIQNREQLMDHAKQIVRKGHTLKWLA